MAYYFDLSLMNLEQLKERLLNRHLVRSRQLLRQNIDANFQKIASLGISNTAELVQQLKNKPSIQEFAAKNNLDIDYVTILIREIKSWHPKPNAIKDIPGINSEVVSLLEKQGIINTKQLYEYIVTPTDRNNLINSSKLPAKEITLLTHITDLSRIRWVNHTFAFMLVEAGYDTCEKVQLAIAEKLHHAINEQNQKHGFYRGQIGLNDFKLVIEAARDIALDVKYD